MREISPEDMPGAEILAGYQTVARLKEGTQSVVYKALGTEPGQALALKILHGWLSENPQIAEAIEKEIATLRSIDHELLARVVDNGRTEENQIYLVSEFITGPDIGRLIDQKIDLGILQIVDMMIQACTGLQAALDKGVIHGDLKPASMVVDSKTRQLRLIDFGFAASLHFPQPEEPPAQTGQMPLVGAAGYLSPEQALGLPIDFRADMFSLGAVFYHLLAKETIFDTSSEGEYLRLVCGSSPLVLKDVCPSCPPEMDAIIMRLLSRKPESRFADYRSVITLLEQAREAIEERQEQAKADEEFRAEAEINAIEERHRATKALLSGGSLGASDALNSTPPEQLASAPAAVPQASGEAPKPGMGVNVDITEVVQDEERRRGRFHPALILLAAFLLIAVVIAVIAGVGGTGHSETSAPAGGIFRGIRNLFLPGSERDLDPDLERQLENYNKMQKVQRGVQAYRSTTGSWPRSMNQLYEEDLIGPVDSLDIWGNEMILLQRSEVILSFGPDGEESTADDWEMNFGGGLVSPPAKLHDYLLRQRELGE